MIGCDEKLRETSHRLQICRENYLVPSVEWCRKSEIKADRNEEMRTEGKEGRQGDKSKW
jgi:hypothetical protein